MKRTITVVCQHEEGVPREVVRVEKWELPEIQPHQALVEMKAAPINPADLNVLEGKYPVREPLPRIVGNEGVGVIVQCGGAVSNLRVGQCVIAPARIGSWCEAYVEDASKLFPVPSEIAVEQGAMLAINPPTAWRMLHDFVGLQPGDWVVQNAANSAVGRFVIQIAKRCGWRTVSIVRRRELVAELEKEGADVVLTDEPHFAKRIREATGGADLRLGLNAVGGDNARELARSLSPHGTLVTYGAMSREPMQLDNGLLIFKDIRFRGFWVSEWYRTSPRDRIGEMLEQIISMVQQGNLKAPVEKTYRLDEAQEAVAHAGRSSRGGKVLFVMP